MSMYANVYNQYAPKIKFWPAIFGLCGLYPDVHHGTDNIITRPVTFYNKNFHQKWYLYFLLVVKLIF